MLKLHYVKSVCIFSHPHFPASVSLRIQSESGKIRTIKTPNTDIFHAVLNSRFRNKIIFNTFPTNIPSFYDFLRILESIEVNGDMSTKCVGYRYSNVVQNCMEIYGRKPISRLYVRRATHLSSLLLYEVSKNLDFCQEASN